MAEGPRLNRPRRHRRAQGGEHQRHTECDAAQEQVEGGNLLRGDETVSTVRLGKTQAALGDSSDCRAAVQGAPTHP